MTHRRWFLRAVLVGLVILGWLGHPSASPVVAKSAFDDSEYLFIRVEAGLVSVDIEDAPLDAVLREIGVQSQIRLVLHGSRPEKISAQFQSVPLNEALRRLLTDNFLLLYSFETDNPLIEVWLAHTRTPLPSPTPAAQESEQNAVSETNPSLDSLILELQEGDVEQRQRAVWLLGDFKDARAVEAVMEALEGDEDVDVRQRAAWVLEELGDPHAIEALAEAVSGDEDEAVRQRAVEALAEIGGDKAVEPLSITLREDPDPFVRNEALASLAEIGGAEVTLPLLEALGDPDELVRTKAEELLDMQEERGSEQ